LPKPFECHGENIAQIRSNAKLRQSQVDITVIGLDVLRKVEGITFVCIANGYGGPTQIIGFFHESMPVPLHNAERDRVSMTQTSLHHFAFEMDKTDYETALQRLKDCGVEVTTPHIRGAI